MKTESKNLLEQQSAWQKMRKKDSWGEKLRKSAQARDPSANLLRKKLVTDFTDRKLKG